MNAQLTSEQEILLKNTREILGQVRDLLASRSAPDSDRDALVESIRQLDELFLLVIAGEFNAGKSSFINALLGKSGLLTEGVTPTTSQIYLLKYGEEVEQIPREKGVWLQTAPVEMLRTINIVDTPGTNAINREHEALTADFIPRSDLVLFLTSADRPFSESERAFLERIRDWGKKVVLVVNKIDIIDNDEERQKVLNFVRDSAAKLVGEVAGVYPISAKQAQKAKNGQPELWEASGFEELESFIQNTLDEKGRFRLKLLNPLGVGERLVDEQLRFVIEDHELLERDNELIEDIEGQMGQYDKDMSRNFETRISEIDNILFQMEKRGNSFFDETFRMGRVTDLIKREYIKNQFEEQVVANVPQQLEDRVGELIDWMVEQDLRQWSAVSDHLARRRDETLHRVVGQSGRQDSTLVFDRQRLVDSVAKTARRTVQSYDRVQQANRIADTAREAVTGLAAGGVGLGLGAALLAMSTAAFLDWTGATLGVGALVLGVFVFPNRRKKAKRELADKLEELRNALVTNLEEQFQREMRRSRQRVEDTVTPFSRFVRAEKEKVEEARSELIELDAHIEGLKKQAEAV